MEKTRTAHLRHRVASTRRISLSAPTRLPAREGFRSSLGEGGFFNLRLLIGLFIVEAGVSLALLGSGHRRHPARAPPKRSKSINHRSRSSIPLCCHQGLTVPRSAS